MTTRHFIVVFRALSFQKVREKHFTTIIIIIIISPFLASSPSPAYHKWLCCVSWFNHRRWRRNTTSCHNLYAAGMCGRTKPSRLRMPPLLLHRRSRLFTKPHMRSFVNHLKAWQMGAGSFQSVVPPSLPPRSAVLLSPPHLQTPLEIRDDAASRVQKRKHRCRWIKVKLFVPHMVIVWISMKWKDGNRSAVSTSAKDFYRCATFG